MSVPDARVQPAALAERQHGVVSRQQLLAAGLTRSMIESRLRHGTLVLLHPGVYAAGHRQLRRDGHRLAALLWAGPGAALSHHEAAALHGLRSARGSRIDITTTRRPRMGRPGVEVHHTAVLDKRDVTTVDGLRTTSVARTLIDLAQIVSRDQLAKAFREAEHLRVLDMTALGDAMRRVRNRPGRDHAALRAVIEERGRKGLQLTRSVLEDRFLKLCDAHGLPRPRTNFHVEGLEVDACWPAARLAVELDSWDRHKDREAFQRDREKGNALTRAGWQLMRFTHDDVVRRPAETAAGIRALLAATRGA